MPVLAEGISVVVRLGERGGLCNETERLVAPRERRHTDVPAGPPRSRDCAALRDCAADGG